MFKTALTGLVLASSLTLAPCVMAQTQRESVVQSIVQPSAGRHAGRGPEKSGTRKLGGGQREQTRLPLAHTCGDVGVSGFEG